MYLRVRDDFEAVTLPKLCDLGVHIHSLMRCKGLFRDIILFCSNCEVS